ncbi:MAG: ABC transporter substrate-binding protein [Clostridiales Family XIII bacterium]|nr:ABC transporter substrate-binding protein [Clostridiales Family XIII bacterium]
MKYKKNMLRSLSYLIALFMIAALAACSSNDANGSQSAGDEAATADASEEGAALADGGEPFTLRVITQPIFNEIIVADELGFFAEEGIEIEYVGAIPSGVTEFQLLEQGEIDSFVSVHPPQVGQARVAGIKAVSVAPGSIDTRVYPHIHYLVREDSDIQSLDDLIGKKIGISNLAACTNGFVDIYLQSRFPDYTPDQVEYIPLGANTEQSLVQGLIDISTAHNPSAGITLAAGGVREIASSADILRQENFSLAARGFLESFIEEHPDVVQGYVNAMYRARLWINDHLEDAIRLNADVLGLASENVSPAIYEQAKNNIPADIERWVDFGESVGNWQAGEIEAEELYTLEFVPDDAPASDKDIRWEGINGE